MSAQTSSDAAQADIASSGPWPLTPAQTGLWYAQQLDPGNPSFNTGHALWLQGPLDVAAFAEAANQAAREAQALCLRFGLRADGQGVQQWLDAAHVPELEIIDLRTCSKSQPDSSQCAEHAEQTKQVAQEAMQADMARPLDPTRDRLARQCLFVLGPGRYCWYQRAHHLLCDGYGMALWEGRVTALYSAALEARRALPDAGATAGASSQRPLGPLQPVIDEALAYPASSTCQADAAYWRELFTPAIEVASLSAQPHAKAQAAHHCLRLSIALPQAWREALLAFAQQQAIPWPDVLTALAALYCQRMAAAAQTVVGIPFMGRLGSASARVPAMVMNVLPLPVAASDEQAMAPWLQTMARAQLQARRHGRYRSEQLRRDLGLLGGQRRLYGALINVQPFYQPVRLPGLQTELEILGTGPIDDLTIGFRGDARQALELELEANPNLYTPEQLQAHLQRLPEFIAQAWLANTLGELRLASQAEAQRCLFDFNATAHPVPQTTLAALIEAQMQRSPQATALEYEGQSLSYAELDARTSALAQALVAQGVGPDALVAVALPRSLELLIALVAVLRAGGAYLPLDLQHPSERLARIVQLARPICALAQQADAARLPAGLPCLPPAAWPTAPAAPDAAQPLPAPQPQHLAYVIYTSGSTGEPKGVMIEHQAIVNRLEWMRQHYGFDASDRILQKTPATFDVSVWEFFLPLLCGGTLVIAPPEAHRDPAWLARIIRQQRIGTCHFVPSMLAAFLAEPQARGIQMRRIFTSGEELPASLRQRLHATLHSQLHNLYGPTEAAVDVSYWDAGPDDHAQPVPIGRPVWNTWLYVLDAQLRPLPPGVAGDLYLGGVQLARGYLGREDLTSAAFVPDPHRPGQRIYKSGDLARWRADGALEYLGRSDQQIKLRGLRIELGEIDATLLRSGMLERASVIVHTDERGDKKLVAYVQPKAEHSPLNSAALLRCVASQLPDYMVPSTAVALQRWPVTANGKLDRRALPAPDFGRPGQGAAPQPLQTATQRQLAQIFAEVLQQPLAHIGADSDFFSLGGDSLSAVQLLLAVQQHWQRNPGLGGVFAQSSVQGLAALIDDERVSFDDGLAPLIALATPSAAETAEAAAAAAAPALAPPRQAQPSGSLGGDAAPLFVIHPAGGIGWGYRHLARALAHPQRTPGMPAQARPRAVYALQSPALAPDQPLPHSIDALAAQYVQRARQIQPQGPLHLLGWSVGGIIAQAMAVHVQANGGSVGLLALLDAYPADAWRAEPEPSPIQALRALLAVAGYDPEGHPELDTQDKVIAFLRQGDTALGHLPDAALAGVVRVVTDTNRLIRQHQQRRYEGLLTHVRAGRDHQHKPHLQAQLWAPYAAQLRTLQVPFLHAELTGPEATAAIAPQLFSP
ncbi:amino acid adenylation domain-containing protein [Comamonadaceae bacterium OH2310_COT-174]|nr:amino acid adenylation domain-containing protein [Comamonadaceae bacterium OH2310_COT-174]